MHFIIWHTFHYTHYTYLHTTVHHHTYNTARCLSQPQVFRYVKSTAENSFWAYVTVCFQSFDVRSTRWKTFRYLAHEMSEFLAKFQRQVTSHHFTDGAIVRMQLVSPCLLVWISLLLWKFENHTRMATAAIFNLLDTKAFRISSLRLILDASPHSTKLIIIVQSTVGKRETLQLPEVHSRVTVLKSFLVRATRDARTTCPFDLWLNFSSEARSSHWKVLIQRFGA